ncbi:MAG: DMP19 family protein [Pirellulaceae bacterium]
MTETDAIWNRAAMENGGTNPGRGDRALAALLHAHGIAMNGGVLHAAELLSDDELADAQSGYRFFGFSAVAEVLARARGLLHDEVDLGRCERELDGEYSNLVPEDATLVRRFEQSYRSHPSDFAPP